MYQGNKRELEYDRRPWLEGLSHRLVSDSYRYRGLDLPFRRCDNLHYVGKYGSGLVVSCCQHLGCRAKAFSPNRPAATCTLIHFRPSGIARSPNEIGTTWQSLSPAFLTALPLSAGYSPSPHGEFTRGASAPLNKPPLRPDRCNYLNKESGRRGVRG